MTPAPSRRAFTHAEAIATVVVLVLIFGAILPLVAGRSRALAMTDECADHLRKIHNATQLYTADFHYFPPSYVYGHSQIGTDWNPLDQQLSNPSPTNGYVHWSGVYSARQYLPDAATTQCPSVRNGGAPNANPGPVAADWEPGQVNDLGATSPSPLPNDRQAKRLAYTMNGAIVGRNKYFNGTPRINRLVPDSEATLRQSDRITSAGPRGIILATEWFVLPGSGPTGGWSSLTTGSATIASRRPITPFLGISAGTDVYSEPNVGTTPRFQYPADNQILTTAQLGPGLLSGGIPELNAVGRHHPGGTANFSLLDGSVVQTTILDTIHKRLWGRRFLAITGNNTVAP